MVYVNKPLIPLVFEKKNRQRKCMKVLAIDQVKRHQGICNKKRKEHQGTCNRKRKGINVLTIDQKKRHQGTCNRKRKGIKVLATEKKASRYLQ